MEKRPNILFIMSDQQRADTIGPNRHPCADYPNLEGLMRESVSFDRFYASSMPCAPSRASFLTGKNAWNFECCSNARFYTSDESLSPNNKSWMQALREAGYCCVSVGKTHMVHAGSFHIQVPLADSFGDEDGWDHFHPKETPASDAAYYDLHTTRRACDALKRLSGEPFALFVGFHAPHEPYVLPKRYLSYCKPEDVPLPSARALSEYEEKSENYRERISHFRRMFGNCIDDDESIRKGIAAYFGAVKMVDDCVGVLLDQLRSLSLWDDTLIVYTSDHGEMLGDHYLFNKNATCYEQESRIPFMLKLPSGRYAGKRVCNLACAVDFYPTLMDWLGIDADVALPGYTLRPCIETGANARDCVLTWYGMASMAIRTQRHKLMYCPETEDGELYDLQADPCEMHNLYRDAKAQGLKASLFQRMLHERMLADKRCSRLTQREWRLHREIYASMEPEVCPLPRSIRV